MSTKRHLHIDLTNETTSIQDIPDEIIHSYIGGIGLGSYFLYQLPSGIDPLGEKNTLFFCVGPAQGSRITLTGRYCLVTKSPLTGFLLDSHAGGNVGSEIAFLGYNIISITGRAAKPVYIYIADNGLVEINSAVSLWGKSTHQTEKALNQFYNLSDLRVISTGQAGEKLVPYSCLVNDRYRNIGRGGAGAIFGAKNLKAIAFYSKKRMTFTNEKIDELAQEIQNRVKAARQNGHPLHSQGTPFLVDYANSFSMYPTRNFQTGFYNNSKRINAESLEKYKPKKKGCYRCALGCGLVIQNHPFEWTDDEEVAVPEYETLGLLGGNLGIHDIGSIIELNHLCNTLGLDTISTGSSLGFLAELKEKNLIPEKIKPFMNEIPSFGDTALFRKLILKVAKKEGLGEFVSLGPAEMANKCSPQAKEFAIHIKKLPMAAWDPRGKFLLGLSYATAAVGASHLRGWSADLSSPVAFDSNNPKHNQAFETIFEEMDLKILKDVTIICHFTHSIHPPLNISDTQLILNGLMNKYYTLPDVRKIAQRIWVIQRLFNIREMTDDPAEYDTLPARFMKEPLKHAPAEKCRAFTSVEEFNQVKRILYKRRGLDEKGNVLPETLKQLSIKN